MVRLPASHVYQAWWWTLERHELTASGSDMPDVPGLRFRLQGVAFVWLLPRWHSHGYQMYLQLVTSRVDTYVYILHNTSDMYILYMWLYVYMFMVLYYCTSIFWIMWLFFSTLGCDFMMVIDPNMTELFSLANYYRNLSCEIQILSMSCIWAMEDSCEQIVRSKGSSTFMAPKNG